MAKSNLNFRESFHPISLLMASDQIPFRRVRSTASRLLQSYCVNCGDFIAAAPNHRLLETIETLHKCGDWSLEAAPRQELDHLLLALSAKEPVLREWISSSGKNSRWFAKDPLGAIRGARLGVDEDLVRQLELIIRSIARKLRHADFT